MRTLLAACILLAANAAAQADAIDDFVNRELAAQQIPGAALAITHNGRLVRAQGYGLANIEHQIPVHADTIFQSGSIGKQFTAVAVMLLVEDGKLRLDESVRTWLPDAPESWAPITVRHLLTQTSGLPATADYDLQRNYTDDELTAICYRLRLEFPPGKRWSYSNAGYELLGILIKKVSGESYADILAERVFAPLHMNTARLISDRDIVMNRAAGYEPSARGLLNQEWVAPTGNSTADGALYLTALDFVKWDAGLRAGEILKPESWAEVYLPVKLASGKTYPYGFGWLLKHFAGQEVHEHSGAWQGFAGEFIRYLDAGVSVAVLTNKAGADPVRIARGVAGIYDARLALPPAAPIADPDPRKLERARRLIAEITADTLKQRDFGGIFGGAPASDFAQQIDAYRNVLRPLGALRDLRLFELQELGDDRRYRYRARFEKGLMNIQVMVLPDGLFDLLIMSPASAWDVPLQP
jgi:CubicO group peptidase (beta-lactamase class C family)